MPLTVGLHTTGSSVTTSVGAQLREPTVGFGSNVDAGELTSIVCDSLLQPPPRQTRRLIVTSPVEPYRVENELSIPLTGEPPAADQMCVSTVPLTDGVQETVSSGSTTVGRQFRASIVGPAPPSPPQAASKRTAVNVNASTSVARFTSEISSRKVVYESSV